jgi:DNA-binding Xre family transcriptional regulator
MKEGVKIRIRASGEGAGIVRGYLAGKLPEAEIVGDDDPAEFVMMTRRDFDEALEDAAAAAAYARTRDEESLPIALADRLLAGESPIRVWREHRRMSLAALSDRAGIGKSYLSQIENGQRTGTVETLKKLARALDIEVDDLI